MFARQELAERKPRYPDVLRVSAPRGLRALVKKTAEARGISASEFVRSAVTEKIAAIGAVRVR
jgi:hypothetical protein